MNLGGVHGEKQVTGGRDNITLEKSRAATAYVLEGKCLTFIVVC